MPSQSKLKSFLFSRWFLIVAFLGLAVTAFAYARAYYQDFQVRQEIARLQEEARKLEVKKLEALEILNYVKSPAFVKEKARTDLNLVNPGEKLTIIEGAGPTRSISRQSQTNVVKWTRVSNIKKWWSYFFDY